MILSVPYTLETYPLRTGTGQPPTGPMFAVQTMHTTPNKDFVVESKCKSYEFGTDYQKGCFRRGRDRGSTRTKPNF